MDRAAAALCVSSPTVRLVRSGRRQLRSLLPPNLAAADAFLTGCRTQSRAAAEARLAVVRRLAQDLERESASEDAGPGAPEDVFVDEETPEVLRAPGSVE